MSEDDWELIRRCRAGAPEAFEPLVHRHESRALAYAGSLLGGRAEAEDAVQEAFVRAYRNLEDLDEDGSFAPWFRAILRNECLDRLKSARRRREEDWPSEGRQPAARRADAPDRLEREALARAIRSAVGELDPRHREVFVLREMDGLSYREIAGALGISDGTVASRLHHARRTLKEVLTDRGVTPEEMNR